jgi:hypothetical protein
MDPATVVAVASAVIGAAGTVAGAWIQSRSRRPREDQPPADATRAGLRASREASPDDCR